VDPLRSPVDPTALPEPATPAPPGAGLFGLALDHRHTRRLRRRLRPGV